MNPIIKDQLNKVKFGKIPEFNDDTTHIIIPKYNYTAETNQELIIGNCYLIEVEKYIIEPFEGFTLHDNWNKGTHPVYKYLKCEILERIGKMIKIQSVGYDHITKSDTDSIWVGWIPEKSAKVLEKL